VARNPGDGWGATTVRGPRETVEKETAGAMKPLKPAASGETVLVLILSFTRG
jgi:hypothetical protein